jgi:hypothetical protein
MSFYSRILIATLLAGITLPVAAMLSVTSFDTEAQANAYAPLSKAMYYDVQDMPNISPASASVSDNWSGTNIGGSTNTWNMVTSANISTTTTVGPNSLAVTGGGGFNYNITTTAAFVDPTSVTTLYVPGADGSYGCFFTVDAPASYTISGQLIGSSTIYFASTLGNVIFQQQHFGTLTKTINVSGIILPGQYQISAGADQSGPSGLSPGINNVLQSGSLNNFSFTLQVPEPSLLVVTFTSAMFILRRRRR